MGWLKKESLAVVDTGFENPSWIFNIQHWILDIRRHLPTFAFNSSKKFSTTITSLVCAAPSGMRIIKNR